MKIDGRTIAAVISLTAFVVAVVAGLGAGNPAGTVLFRAILAMLCAQAAGLVVGMLFERMLAEHLNQYHAAQKASPSVPVVAEEVVEVGEVGE